MPPTIVHFSTDTLPRVVEGRAGAPTLDLLLPFRVDAPEGGLHVASWRLEVHVDGRSWTDRTRTRRLQSGLAGALRDRMQRHGRFTFDHLPYYAALRDADIDAGRAVYVEGRVPGVPAGATVTYTLTVTVAGTGPVASRPYTTQALSSRFDHAQIRKIHIPEAGRADQAWVLYHQREDRYDRFRVDVVELSEGLIAPERAPLTVKLLDGTAVLELDGDESAVLPLVDVAADAVTFAVPHDGGVLSSVDVQYRHAAAVTVHLDDRAAGETRVMIVNFAIQGLNDLFATADDDYTPPRTYTQVTMRDEAASYSSRPGSRERHTGDGYELTLDAHRRYGVPQLWAMNGGLLGLLAHDRPDALETMRADVDAGLLVPVVAGYGAHRLPYYRTETNTDAVVLGDEAMRSILGRTSAVYYPDSRITTDAPQIRDALRAAGVRYLVVDAGEGEGLGDDSTRGATVVVGAKPELGTTAGTAQDPLYVSWQNMWFDTYTETTVLFIDPELKDKLFQTDDWQADRGKVHYDLRRKFIELAAQPTLRAGNLVVYSDDADKASGNGWFDGFYRDGELPYNHRYQAALSWLSTHPWVRVVTTAELDEEEPVGRLHLQRASDPKMPDWNLGIRKNPGEPSFDLDFDTWYYAWAHNQAAWLGESLAAISIRAENAIAHRRAVAHDDELVLLARLYLTLCLHESQWSKRARIDDADAPGRTDVENFVVAESLQLRNAHVYLNASFWAQWAATAASDEEHHRDDGDVIRWVAEFEKKESSASGPPAWSRAGQEGLQWDHDPLPNVVLYNRHALVVIDRNGGRITHLFAMLDGRPVSVSGTHKAYQFLDMDWASDGGVECDGSVLQNTVATPNHAYVACDIDASRGTIGASPAGDPEFDWYYPDNFNAYDVTDPTGLPEVTLTYGPATTDAPAPATIADLERELADDREQKVAGGRGIVRHDIDEFGAFAKTIRLDGRTVHVEYRGTRPGHRVANEFCVDLVRSALHGQRQTHAVAADGLSGTVTNEGGLEVRVALDAGCAFTEAACAPLDPPTVESLRLHRVMTDNLEIVAPDGGDFSYRIVLF